MPKMIVLPPPLDDVTLRALMRAKEELVRQADDDKNGLYVCADRDGQDLKEVIIDGEIDLLALVRAILSAT